MENIKRYRRRVAKFEKVSFERFRQDVKNCFGSTYDDTEILHIYNDIELPCRATSGSAGYDFKIPFPIEIKQNEAQLIPTGIRVKMDEVWVLKLYPRSGLGFKYGLKLLNTVGIIDSDYYNSDNEGHIMAKIVQTENSNPICFEAGAGFIQGIFIEYGITEDDEADGVRNGGFGSTGK